MTAPGILQLVFDPEHHPAAHETAHGIRNEYVISAEGVVRARGEDQVNPGIATGRVELPVDDLVVLARAKTPPFYPEDDLDVDETLRLKYRYLDLRRPSMQRNLMLRDQVVQATRRYLETEGFVEVETPILTKSTPEGARDFLVPSRLRPAEFYALPQSPQLFKQLLMVAGFERYYQIARSFRDEDLRADRQPEFTQIDLEMSFVDEQDIQDLVEGAMARVFLETLAVDLPRPFPRLTFRRGHATLRQRQTRHPFRHGDRRRLRHRCRKRASRCSPTLLRKVAPCAGCGWKAEAASPGRTSTTLPRRRRSSAQRVWLPCGSRRPASARRSRSS